MLENSFPKIYLIVCKNICLYNCIGALRKNFISKKILFFFPLNIKFVNNCSYKRRGVSYVIAS